MSLWSFVCSHVQASLDKKRGELELRPQASATVFRASIFNCARPYKSSHSFRCVAPTHLVHLRGTLYVKV